MDESHRLKPFSTKWNTETFEEIFNDTRPLRKSLASQIDHRRFGVDQAEIVAWFDVKFIHAFEQYMLKYDTSNTGDLKGYIIRALQQYKYRVMRKAYQAKYKDHPSTLDITELYDERVIDKDEHNKLKDGLLDRSMGFLKEHLSADAYCILEIELNPPSYITREIAELGKKKHSKIPNKLIAEYLGWPINDTTVNYVGDLRKECKLAIIKARDYFSLVQM